MKRFTRIGVCLLLLAIACWATVTTVNKVAITNSTIDNSVIGGTTPSTATFTTLTGTLTGSATSLASTTNCSGVSNLATGINTSGAAQCVAAVHGGVSGSGCTTGSSNGATCTVTVNLDVTMPDTNYKASCSQVSGGGYPFIIGISKGTSSITVTISNGASAQAVASTASEVDCTTFGS